MDDFNQGQNPMPATPTNDVPVVEPVVEPTMPVEPTVEPVAETPSEPMMPTPMTPPVQSDETTVVPPATDQPVV